MSNPSSIHFRAGRQTEPTDSVEPPYRSSPPIVVLGKLVHDNDTIRDLLKHLAESEAGYHGSLQGLVKTLDRMRKNAGDLLRHHHPAAGDLVRVRSLLLARYFSFEEEKKVKDQVRRAGRKTGKTANEGRPSYKEELIAESENENSAATAVCGRSMGAIGLHRDLFAQ